MTMLRQQTHESVEISHPGQVFQNYVVYNITHNKGRRPDKIELLVKYSGNTYFRDFSYYYSNYTGNYNSNGVMPGVEAGTTDNKEAIRVYRVESSSAETIKFRFTWN